MGRGLARLILLAVLTGSTGLVAGCSGDASAGSDDGSGGSESPTTTSTTTSPDDPTSPTDPTESPESPEPADPGTPEGLLSTPSARDALAVARVQVLDLTALSPQTRADLEPGLRQRSTGGFQARLGRLVDRFAAEGGADGGTEGSVGAIGLESIDAQSASVLVAATATASDGASRLFRVSLGRAGDSWLVDDTVLDDVAAAPSSVLDDTGLGEVPGQVEQLLSYTPRDVLTGLDAEAAFMTDAFAREYRRAFAIDIAPEARRRDITTTADVRAAGLSTGRAAQASLLLVVDLEARRGSAPPQRSPTWVTVDLRNVGGTWMIDGLESLGGSPGDAG